MDKLEKTHILKLFLIAALLIVTPLLSASLRTTYLYFVVNVLILVVGAEAGLLSFFLRSPENYKKRASAMKPVISPEVSSDNQLRHGNSSPDKIFEKCSSEKIVGAVKEQKVKKSPSTPSIFFIGGGDQSGDTEVSVEENGKGEEIGEVSEQELFQKAESFIGNFYKQLKMQREESWKKLHDLYQKAF